MLVTSAVAVILPGLLDHGMRTGAADVLASAPATARSVHLTESSSGSSDLDARGRRVLGALFPAGSVEVTSAGRAAAVPVLVREGGDADVGSQAVVVGAVDQRTGIRVVEGRWPSRTTATGQTVSAAIQVDAAEALHLAVGDPLTVGQTTSPVHLRVAALWRATDPAAARWFGDSLTGSGRDDPDLGPVLVSPTDLDALSGTLDVDHSWTIEAHRAATAPDTIEAVRAGLSGAADALARQRVASSDDLDTAGDLPTTLQGIAGADAVTRALVTVATALVGAAGAVAVAQLAVLVGTSRRPEDELLRARGASTRQFARMAVAEALVLALPPAVIGAGLGIAIVAFSEPPGVAQLARAGLTAIAAAVVAALLAGAVAVRDARSGSSRAAADPASNPASGRAGASGRVSPLLLLAVALILLSGLAVWRLLLYGSPLTDEGRADVLASISPVLVLLAGGLLVAVLAAPLATAAARLAEHGRGARAVLVARQVARRNSAFAAPILALALVVASAGFASSFGATTSSVEQERQVVQLGGDARVTSTSGDAVVQPGASAAVSPPLAALAGVSHAAAVLSDTAAIGETQVSVVGASAATWAHLDTAAETSAAETSAAGASRLHTLLHDPRLAGVPLPNGTRNLSMAVEVGVPSPSASGAVSLVAWLVDADGVTVAAPLRSGSFVVGEARTTGSPLAFESTATVSTPLPDGAGAWRLVAVEPTLQVSGDPNDLSSTTVPLRVDGVRAARDSAGTGSTSVSASRDHTLSSATPSGRLAFAGAGSTGEGRLPVVVTDSLADAIGVSIGSPIDLALRSTSQTVPAVVRGVVPVVPGSNARQAVAVDLPGLVQRDVLDGGAVPRAGEAVVDTSRPGDLASEVARTLPYPAEVTDRASISEAPIVETATGAVWLATLAAALLAVVVLAAAAIGLARSRREESAVFRALGVPPRSQGRLRAAELAVAGLVGIVGGALVGFAASALVAARFGVAASPGASALIVTAPVFDPALWVLVVLVVASACALVIVVAGASVRGRAAASRVRGDDR